LINIIILNNFHRGDSGFTDNIFAPCVCKIYPDKIS
jgi:hypothetical protein